MGRSSGRKRDAVLGFLGLTSSGGAAAETPVAEKEAVAGSWWLQSRQPQYQHAGYGGGTAATGAAWTAGVRRQPSRGAADGYYYDDGRQQQRWYCDDYAAAGPAERDIDRRASEFIDRVHRGMLAGGAGADHDGGPPRPHSYYYY